jgi:hypothetical protein
MNTRGVGLMAEDYGCRREACQSIYGLLLPTAFRG